LHKNQLKLNQRFYSLDVFRGMTVALMILVNNQGDWGHIFPPFAHAPWHGCTPTDLVFPFFLFAVGNAMAFVIPKLKEAGTGYFYEKVVNRSILIFLIGLLLAWSPFITFAKSAIDGAVLSKTKQELWFFVYFLLILAPFCLFFYVFRKKGHVHNYKIIKQACLALAIIIGVQLILFWLGSKQLGGNQFLNAKPLSNVRLLGVLQRIAICYLIAAMLVYFIKEKWIIWVSVGCLIIYHIISSQFWNTSIGDPYSLNGFLGTLIDRDLLGAGHIYKGEYLNGVAQQFDPEGLFSTIGAVFQVVFGYLAGAYILKKGKTTEMVMNLFFAGCLCLFIGFCWNYTLPINKKLWTSSYTIYTTGLAFVVLASFVYLIEFKNYKKFPTNLFNVFGKNPLFIFVLIGFLPRLSALFRWENGLDKTGSPTFTSFFPWFFNKVCLELSWGHIETANLIYGLSILGFCWAICYYMDKKKIYVKV
jgi:predicted acyltransferase